MVSSRLGKKLDQYPQVFEAIRAKIFSADSSEVLVTGNGMTLDRFVRRAAEWQGLKTIQVVRSSAKQSLSSDSAYLLVEDHSSIDDVLIQSCDQVIVLNASPNGNTTRAIEKRLKSDRDPSTLWLLADSSNPLFDQWQEQGAVVWHLFDNAKTDAESESPIKNNSGDKVPDIHFDEYLIHCTRTQSDGYVDETENEWIDRLLFNSVDHGLPSPYSALGTLLKIVVQQKLVAGNQTIRGKYPSVSFTEVPLPSITNLRTFRPHRARWDFEPYGLAIRKDIAAQFGVQKVTYGDQSRWESMSERERPFFQKRFSDNGKIDWSTEQEWRSFGCIDLRQIDESAAFVFVEKTDQVSLITSFSRWPVVDLQSVGQSKD